MLQSWDLPFIGSIDNISVRESAIMKKGIFMFDVLLLTPLIQQLTIFRQQEATTSINGSISSPWFTLNKAWTVVIWTLSICGENTIIYFNAGSDWKNGTSKQDYNYFVREWSAKSHKKEVALPITTGILLLWFYFGKLHYHFKIGINWITTRTYTYGCQFACIRQTIVSFKS